MKRPLTVAFLALACSACAARAPAVIRGALSDEGPSRCFDIAPAFPISYGQALDDQVMTAWYAWEAAWPSCLAGVDSGSAEPDPASELRLRAFDVSAREITVQAAFNRDNNALACRVALSSPAASDSLVALLDRFAGDLEALRTTTDDAAALREGATQRRSWFEAAATRTCTDEPRTDDAR